MRQLPRLAGTLVTAACVAAAEYTISSQGHAWTIHGWAPEDGPSPLVIVLHGAGGDGQRYLEKNHWLSAAKQHGFAVVAPSGLPAAPGLPANFATNPRVWNSGQLSPRSARTKIDDVAFVAELIGDARKRWKIDPKRIYVAGHSNGGAMAFQLAVRMPERIAAIAPVGSMLFAKGPNKVPALWIYGRQDPLNPYAGGESVLPWGKRQNRPMEDAFAEWSAASGCKDKPLVKKSPLMERRSYCNGFELVILEDHGHGWPGGAEGGLLRRSMGPSTANYNATREIWEFFRARTTQ